MTVLAPAAREVRARAAGPVPLVVGGMFSTQFGAALARSLFGDLSPGGTVLLRVGFAAVALLLVFRPRMGGTRRDLGAVLAFGVALGLMNLTFYEAIARIPLGVAVTLEFIGPLGVALAGSRRRLDLVWVALAAGGIVLLSDGIGAGLDPLGVGLALLAGAFWAAYIVCNARVGRLYPGGSGLALAMVVAAAVVAVPGVVAGGAALGEPRLLGLGLGVALLSSAIPYSLETEALRRLPQHVFGVLMSLEPAVAALAGFAALGQSLGARQLVAIALVVAASAGAAAGVRAQPAG